MSKLIRYSYAHQQTEATTGYFSCLPDPLPGPDELIRLLAERPLDSFLRRYALGLFGVADEPGPLLYGRRAALPDAPLHAAWAEVFNANIQGHRKLDAPGELAARGVSPLFTQEVLDHFAAAPQVSLPGLPKAEAALKSPMPAAEVAELALQRLRSAGAVAGPEQRHVASLSPIALLMPWRLDVSVSDGRNNFTLKGQANTYGRGMSLAQCRASCRMEMVERFSAYLSIAEGEVKDRATPMPIRHARWSELQERGGDALNPNDFYIEAPYNDEELVWVQGLRAQGAGEYRPVWAPLQLAALFSNCDEIDLSSAPGSTGIATGSVIEQARLAALTEVLERDSEATTLYHKKRCFQLDAGSVPPGPDGEALAALLRDYRALGINLQFMDMTGPLGLPCYQAFVIGPKGSVHRGHGASLSGPRALVSAITECPYPYPEGGPSGPMLRNLPLRGFCELPDYSSGSVKADLALVESLLCANGLNPVYVDLTHSALEFPVVRALVPGMQLAADFDGFTRLSPRLYKDYLSLYG